MAEGQKKQKKKVVKMGLGEFLSDTTLGSWADEMDDLPSAPADDFRSGGYGMDRGGRGFSGRGGFGDREESRYPPRAPVELPTRAPFTIHLGNLSFDVAEQEIEGFFVDCKIIQTRIMKDFEDKPKGFGYVEFDTLDDLKRALEYNGQSLCGRNVRVSIAEPPRERVDRPDRTTGDWRREREPAPSGPPSGGRFGSDRLGGDRDRERGDFGDRPARRDTEAPASASSGSGSSRSNPFGGAKPVDSEGVLRRVEEKLEKGDQERKEAQDKARKDKEGKKETAAADDKKQEADEANVEAEKETEANA
ncbi:hypothetical protein BGW38_001467 [Lunasporangiospora selenospora]|uniref:RRM domain-containing protein n=1 Tax=Lunasporangiospora selenospora TaxID=979761 RepID=A0A9P6FU53_9FUNG|nr:hypothetical protein BGW38_001467 [Lunasporangiospora selenospora]